MRLVQFQLNATLVKVIDGDTIRCDIDWGMCRYDHGKRVRLAGIAARSTAEPGGAEARDHLASLLPVGCPLALLTLKPYKYRDEWAANVLFLDASGAVALLNDYLVMTHWALPWGGLGAQPKPPWPRPS